MSLKEKIRKARERRLEKLEDKDAKMRAEREKSGKSGKGLGKKIVVLIAASMTGLMTSLPIAFSPF